MKLPSNSDFVKAFKDKLASDSVNIDKNRWAESDKYRTHVLKGNTYTRDNNILINTLKGLGYSYPDGKSLVNYELNQKDIIISTGEYEKWAESAWSGNYQYEIVLELENNLSEFQMTVRGLFEIRAPRYIGIFFTGNQDEKDILIGYFPHENKHKISFLNWLPWINIPVFKTLQFNSEDSLLIIFLSSEEPTIILSYEYFLATQKRNRIC